MLGDSHAQAGGDQFPRTGLDNHFALLRQEGGNVHRRRILGLIFGQGRLLAAALDLLDQQPWAVKRVMIVKIIK